MTRFTLASLLERLYSEWLELKVGGADPNWFRGPDSWYAQLVTQLAADQPAARPEAACSPGQEPITIAQLCELPADARLKQLAWLHLGDSSYNADSLMTCLGDEIGTVYDPTPHQTAWYAAAVSYLNAKISASTPRWTIGYWRALGFVNDWLNRTGQPLQDSHVERTPILLANGTVGRVLWLVAERVPGPPIVTPHWWRLGQVPLGNSTAESSGQPELQFQIQSTMERTLRAKNWQWQVRWWLETYPKGGGWHEAIDQAPSIQAAVACLTLALGENSAIRPVLDGQTAVTATCNEQEQIGQVGFLRAKIAACQSAGIHCVVLSSELAREDQQFALQHAHDVQRLVASQLCEAYEILQATSPKLKTAKQHYVRKWLATFTETETEQRFIDASD